MVNLFQNLTHLALCVHPIVLLANLHQLGLLNHSIVILVDLPEQFAQPISLELWDLSQRKKVLNDSHEIIASLNE